MTWHLHRSDLHGIEGLRCGPATLSLRCPARSDPRAATVLEVSSDQPCTLEIRRGSVVDRFPLTAETRSVKLPALP